MSDVLKKFGRYFLLDRIAQGGMAEIFRARMVAVEGASRLMVIKKIQTGYGTNQEFIKMFKSETQVTMNFNHPNIVQVYDYGEEQDQHYIAMEFVDGKNLRQMIGRFGEKESPVPMDLAAYIIEQVANGLHYAHTFKDKITGNPLNIIHRDISPQNIIISYEGIVKVIDFGIAKAAVNMDVTRAGVIKGKPSYLSPEQITGESVDKRSDLFSLGTVLWELLTGRKLFSGDGDLAILRQIESCATHVKAPSNYNSDVPKELDMIVLQALAKQKEKRFQSADEMARALHKFVYQFNPEFMPSALSDYAKNLFKEEIVEDRKKIQKLSEKAEKLLSHSVPEVTPVAEERGFEKEEDTTTVFEVNSPDQSSPREVKPHLPKNRTPISVDPAELPRRSVRTPAERARIQTPQRPAIQLKAPPRKDLSTGGSFSKVASIVAVLGLGAWSTSEYWMKWIPKKQGTQQRVIAGKETSTKDQKEVGDNEKTAQQEVPSAELKLAINPDATDIRVSINGQPLQQGARQIKVPLDSPLKVVLERPGYRMVESEFMINSRMVQNGIYAKNLVMDPVQFGYFTIYSTPSGEAVLTPREGRGPGSEKTPIRMNAPFQDVKVPAGSYDLKVVNEDLGLEYTDTVVISDNSRKSLSIQLRPKGK